MIDQRTPSGETVMGMPVTAYMQETQWGGLFATHWSTIPDHRNPIRLFAEADVRARLDKLTKALEDMCAEFRAHDLPYGSKAYTQANALLQRLK